MTTEIIFKMLSIAITIKTEEVGGRMNDRKNRFC